MTAPRGQSYGSKSAMETKQYAPPSLVWVAETYVHSTSTESAPAPGIFENLRIALSLRSRQFHGTACLEREG